MGPKIKTFVAERGGDILAAISILLLAFASFQVGRLSVLYGGTSDFTVTERGASTAQEP